MRQFCLFVLHAFLLWGISVSYEYQVHFFKQKVDHFGYANDDYFFQRYLVNSDFYSASDGTIFFYTGNEGDIEMFANNTGFMWENAKAFNALIVFAEHRYYGMSLPYGNESFMDNLHRGYLTSEQALADFAVLISHIKLSLPGGGRAPVIAFGGSYGGMLAAWIRMKYPHLVNGAIASSAPVLMSQNVRSCNKFAEVVTSDFQQVSVDCAASIQKSWKTIRLFGSTKRGRKFLSKTFRLCTPLTSSTIDNLINWLSATWEFMAMTDYPYPTKFLNPIPAYPINVSCKHLQDATVPMPDLLINVFKAASVFQNYTGNVECFNLTQTGGSHLGEKGWDFQACTEMVQPICRNGETDMFEPVSWNFTTYSENCWQTWKVKPEMNKTLIMYGGKNIIASSNIIFTNGKLDPWYPGGILESLSDTLISILMESAAHHLDLRSSNPADPPSITEARKVILKYISEWTVDAKKKTVVNEL